MFKEIIFSTEVVNDIRRAAGDSGDIERLIWELSHVVENYRDGIKNIEYLRPLKEQSGLRLSNIAKHAKALAKALTPIVPRKAVYEGGEKMDFDGDSSHMLLDAYGTSCLLDQVQNDIRNYDEVRLLSEKLIRLNLSALQAKKNRKLPPTPEWILRRNIYHAVLSSSTSGKLQTSDTSVLVKLSRIIYTSERIDIPGCFHDAYKPIVKIFKHRYK